MNILVTGGAGFIGSSLVDKLLKQNHKVVVADNLLTGKLENVPIHPNVSFYPCNVNILNELNKIFFKHKFDIVFHYAAVVGVARTLEDPLLVLEDIKGFENILSCSLQQGVKKVLFSSSSEVYGEPVELPLNEKFSPLNSRLPYAVVKNIGENYIKSFHQKYNLSYNIFRFFNTYGPSQSCDFVVKRFISNALEDKPIEIYGDGSQTRTFCYIDDNVDICLAATNSNKHNNLTLNVGSEKQTTILELANLIIKLTNSNSKIIHLEPLPEGDMTCRQPDIKLMKSILKRDLKPLEDGLKDVINSLSS